MNRASAWISEPPFVEAATTDPPETAIVLRGGGIKGLALVGALYELLQAIRPAAYIGTSAGAILAVLLGAGYSAPELMALLGKTDFAAFLDATPLRAVSNFALKKFLFPGDEIEDWIDKALRSKLLNAANIPLSQLKPRVVLFAAEPRFGTLVLDSEGQAAGFGAVAAARWSMSIPFVFKPPIYEGRPVYDGGVIRNFPLLAAINEMGFSRERVFGLYLGSASSLNPSYRTRGVMRDLIRIWLNQDEAQILDRFRDRIIEIDTAPIWTMQFRLTETEKEYLVLAGRIAAASFLTTSSLGAATGIDTARLEQATQRRNVLRDSILYERRRVRRRRGRRLVLSGGTVAFMLFVVWSLIRMRETSHSLCFNGNAFVRIPAQDVEIPVAQRLQNVHVGTFYAAQDILGAPEKTDCDGRRSEPPFAGPDSWIAAAQMCADGGARLPTEAELRAIEQFNALHSGILNTLGLLRPWIHMADGVPEFTLDCNSDVAFPSNSINPVATRDGCFEHITLSIQNGVVRRNANTYGARFRCVMGTGIDKAGRVARWNVAGPLDYPGCGGELIAPKRITLLDGVAAGASVGLEGWKHLKWGRYDSRFEGGQSVSCSERQVTCSTGRGKLSIDLERYFQGQNQSTANQMALVSSYLVSSVQRKVEVRVAGDDRYIVWLNGQQIAAYRGPCDCLDEARAAKTPAEIKQGNNLLVALVGNGDNWWGLSVRILDERGEPVVGLGATTEPHDDDLVIQNTQFDVPRLGQGQ